MKYQKVLNLISTSPADKIYLFIHLFGNKSNKNPNISLDYG